eukprot:4624905-Amphidinium_carterae.1
MHGLAHMSIYFAHFSIGFMGRKRLPIGFNLLSLEVTPLKGSPSSPTLLLSRWAGGAANLGSPQTTTGSRYF